MTYSWLEEKLALSFLTIFANNRYICSLCSLNLSKWIFHKYFITYEFAYILPDNKNITLRIVYMVKRIQHPYNYF